MLSEAQAGMLAVVIETGAAWTTAPDSPNHVLLEDWASSGFFEQINAPAPFLVAYRITPAGRSALEDQR